MSAYENAYCNLVSDILSHGELRKGRNGNTISTFGQALKIDMSMGNEFPLLLGRKLYYKGVLAELAAMLKGPKSIADFELQGCNYWKDWGNEDGSINVDYGNAWLDFNGFNQLAKLKDTLKNNPMDRRMIISGWRPDRLDKLNLPCCHLLYQWYVREGEFLDMIWYQRSVDTMIGLPSDVILAAVWNILLANETGYKPGRITMVLGDTHIYEEHIDNAKAYLIGARAAKWTAMPTYKLAQPKGFTTELFVKDDLVIENYNPQDPIKFELKA